MHHNTDTLPASQHGYTPCITAWIHSLHHSMDTLPASQHGYTPGITAWIHSLHHSMDTLPALQHGYTPCITVWIHSLHHSMDTLPALQHGYTPCITAFAVHRWGYVQPPKTACGSPCGGRRKETVADAVLSHCERHLPVYLLLHTPGNPTMLSCEMQQQQQQQQQQ